jgi:uncharacterized protein YjbJ (UPF0337 family)
MPEEREKLSGRTKEAAGKATRDERLEAEGKAQLNTAEAKAKAKLAVDKAKRVVDGAKEAFKKDGHKPNALWEAGSRRAGLSR